jgi:phage terminase large subunit
MAMLDPIRFFERIWPDVRFFDKQEEVLRSLVTNDITVCVAGHQLGKDYIAGASCLYFFLTRHPVRVVTTSIRSDHMRVLWGEIGHFVQTAKYPLEADNGGPLVLNHWDFRKVVHGKVCPISYLRGIVSEKGEGMAGHHAEHTLAVLDEASGIDDVVFERVQTWAKRILVIGNPYPPQVGCTFFQKTVKAGDVLAKGV